MLSTRQLVLALFVLGSVYSERGIAAAQSVPPPTVSPDPLPDVPPTSSQVGIPFSFFNNYSWRSFIALNWPAQTGAEQRGQPNRSEAFGDTDGPRVWMTWKSQSEIFQPGGVAPSEWNSYAGANPCGPTVSNSETTLSSFSEFGDFNQAVFSLAKVGNPLIAQNRTYIRYDVRVNQPEFDSIVQHGWYVATNLPTKDNPETFNAGSTEIKAAWRILTDADTPQIRSRYYVVPNVEVFDVATGKCILHDIALVGLHIVTKTPDRPQWIWSTFEQVDNVPGITNEPKPPKGIPFSFNDSAGPKSLSPLKAPPAISPTNLPLSDPTPMQVIRKQPILPETMAMNQTYWNLPGIKGTVWQNYMLIMTQWPTQVSPEDPTNDGDFFPSGGSELANTTMETYFQSDGSSCMACHQTSNSQGRDFVMFVTFDSFRPGIAAPADLFASELIGGKKFEPQPPQPLVSDPLVKSITSFVSSLKSP